MLQATYLEKGNGKSPLHFNKLLMKTGWIGVVKETDSLVSHQKSKLDLSYGTKRKCTFCSAMALEVARFYMYY